MQKIFVIVRDGTAKVCKDTVPDDIVVEVIDLDMIRMGESFPSKDAFDYCKEKNFFANRRKEQRASEPLGDINENIH